MKDILFQGQWLRGRRKEEVAGVNIKEKHYICA
jgi:hypothetical protein